MCICVHCNFPLDHVYTTFKTLSNIRLEVCPGCGLFADPLIEHPPTIILVDLLLLKPRVYRHLLFNHGSEPVRAGALEPLASGLRRKAERGTYVQSEVIRWGIASIIVDTVVRITQNHNRRGQSGVSATSTMLSESTAFRAISPDDVMLVAGTLALVTIETLVQHLITTAIARQFLSRHGWLGRSPGDGDGHPVGVGNKTMVSKGNDGVVVRAAVKGLDRLEEQRAEVHRRAGRRASVTASGAASTRAKEAEVEQKTDESVAIDTEKSCFPDGRPEDFHLAYVSLALIYSSLLPLSLHLITSIWSVASPTSQTSGSLTAPVDSPSTRLITPLLLAITSYLHHFIDTMISAYPNVVRHVTEWAHEADKLRVLLKRDGMGEVWMAVHLLEGMSSGGALRVLLPTKPWETSLIVLTGLLARTALTVAWQEGFGQIAQ